MAIELGRNKWAGYAAHTEEMKYLHERLVRKPEGKTTLLDLSVDGMIILKLICDDADCIYLSLDRDHSPDTLLFLC